MMGANEAVRNICNLPIDFLGGSKSMLQLISESGLDEHPSILVTGVLVPHLREHPELVGAWIRWSADKRVPSGWYFYNRGKDYVVGLYPNGETSRSQSAEYACAEFIVHEIGSVMATRSEA